jgi:hypothetical protein
MPVPVTPTPVVCNDLDALQRMTLLPGQAFVCTFSEQQLTASLRDRPENPCADASVTLTEDGQLRMTCHMGFLVMRATGVVEARNCRMEFRVVSGTAGFAQLVQQLIEQNLAWIPYDRVCIEDAEVSEGQMTIAGHGR